MDHFSSNEGPSSSSWEWVNSDQQIPDSNSSKVSENDCAFISAPHIKDTLGWTKVFPISYDSGVGVNLQSPVYEIEQDVPRNMCQATMKHSDNEQHSGSTDLEKVPYFGTLLTIGGWKDGNEDKTVLFSSLCQCSFCIQKPVDALKLGVITATLNLIHEGAVITADVTFYPGVTNNFDMKKENHLCSSENIIYFSKYFKVINNTCCFLPFQDPESSVDVMKYNEPKSLLPETWIPPVIVMGTVGPNDMSMPRPLVHLKLDMEILSSDGKSFLCHSSILTVQSPVLAIRYGQLGPIRVCTWRAIETSTVINAFLKYIYFRNIETLKSLDFEASLAALKMACELEVTTLLGVISRIVSVNLKEKITPADLNAVERLCKYLQTKDKFQILARLFEIATNKAKELQQWMDEESKIANEDCDGACNPV